MLQDECDDPADRDDSKCFFANSSRLRSAASSLSVIAFSSAFNFSFSCESFNTFDARFWTFSTLKLSQSSVNYNAPVDYSLDT